MWSPVSYLPNTAILWSLMLPATIVVEPAPPLPHSAISYASEGVPKESNGPPSVGGVTSGALQDDRATSTAITRYVVSLFIFLKIFYSAIKPEMLSWRKPMLSVYIFSV